MQIVDSGVLAPSKMDFTLPSAFARQALYYVPQFGHFYCNPEYHISRESLDLFLLVYVCTGTLYVRTEGRSYSAAAGQAVLLDCRTPHEYYCQSETEFLWFHFNGAGSIPYARLLYDQFGVVFSGEHLAAVRQHFDAVLAAAQTDMINEHQISVHVHQILSRLAVPARQTVVMNNLLSPAIDYIAAHYEEPLDLSRLSTLCSLSTSHFIRCFKKYAGCTPHDYLLSFRLRQAKQRLLTTRDSIEQIADRCGFNSASHFSRAFRKDNGMTPSEFRRLQF